LRVRIRGLSENGKSGDVPGVDGSNSNGFRYVFRVVDLIRSRAYVGGAQ